MTAGKIPRGLFFKYSSFFFTRLIKLLNSFHQTYSSLTLCVYTFVSFSFFPSRIERLYSLFSFFPFTILHDVQSQPKVRRQAAKMMVRKRFVIFGETKLQES